jgi:hypothetical protein
VALDPVFGNQAQILNVTNSIEFGVSKKTKHSGVKKAGISHLINGLRYGVIYGPTVDVKRAPIA